MAWAKTCWGCLQSIAPHVDPLGSSMDCTDCPLCGFHDQGARQQQLGAECPSDLARPLHGPPAPERVDRYFGDRRRRGPGKWRAPIPGTPNRDITKGCLARLEQASDPVLQG